LRAPETAWTRLPLRPAGLPAIELLLAWPLRWPHAGVFDFAGRLLELLPFRLPELPAFRTLGLLLLRLFAPLPVRLAVRLPLAWARVPLDE
jgi:hypothetical protein